jgi:NAD(P)-dependent dehydrogenase (short-subunit alcohol dehydrogenase family)
VSNEGEGGGDKVALVTGAGSGMGAACARRLAADRHAVVLFDLRPGSLEPVAADVRRAGAEAEAVSGDLSEPADVDTAVRLATERFGRLDVLVNAAGIAESTRFFDLTLPEWRRVLAVNLTGAFLVTQAAARPMRERGRGRIVHFSSTAGKTVSTLGGAHYTASKHGVLGLVRATAKELAGFGITVNAVCPGLIDTPMVQAFTSGEERTAFAESFPIPRLGQPEEVADLVAFLASDGAAYITGAAVDINGGDLMV